LERPADIDGEEESAFATDETRVFPAPWGAVRVHSNSGPVRGRSPLRSLPALEHLDGVWHFTGRRLVDFDRIDVWNPERGEWEPCHFWGRGGAPVFVCLQRWGTIQVHSGLLARWRPSVPIEL
jgi:hypothetical protein